MNSGPAVERVRWRCRRGMLELDLVLKAFTDRHLETLDADNLEVFAKLLNRSDPELLDLLMGRVESDNAREQDLLQLIHSSNTPT